MAERFEHSVECPVDRDFAWRFWTNVENWAAVDSSVESVTLEGPFAEGSKGRTKPRGLPPAEWELIEVVEGRRAVIGVEVPGAVFTFRWVFERTPAGGTRITQRVSVAGERAAEYKGAVGEFARGVPAGMRSLADAMAKAAGTFDKHEL